MTRMCAFKTKVKTFKYRKRVLLMSINELCVDNFNKIIKKIKSVKTKRRLNTFLR